MEQQSLFEMNNITKSFPGVKALSDASLFLTKCRVLAVVGENGAGKSTLMNIMLGSIKPDKGEMKFKGKPFAPKSPAEALKAGISMIHQELTLVPEMTVSENIWLGQEKKFQKGGLLNVREREKATKKLLDELKISVNPRKKVNVLSVAEMQLVEIARAVSYNSEVIIMDEPTSALTVREIKVLYDIIKSLTKKNIAITFITHKLDEIFSICDDIMIMRDGQVIDRKQVSEVTQNEIITKMVGHDMTNHFLKEEATIGEVVLEVKNLSRKGYFKDISFSVRKGEILGFSGLVKAGRSEVMECIFGIDKPDSGEILMFGEKLKIKDTKDAIKYKMAMVTEDRLRRGVIHMHSVRFNTSLAYLQKITKNGFVNRHQEENDCLRIKKVIGIKAASLEQPIGHLSGGNQQKVIIGKWLLAEAELIIFDEPTRGIDVGAKAEIYRLMCNLAKEGKAIIMVSSELPEIMAISDRMIVMAHGKMMAELNHNEYEEKKIMQYAFGFENANS